MNAMLPLPTQQKGGISLDAAHDWRIDPASYAAETDRNAAIFAAKAQHPDDRAYYERSYRQIAQVFAPSLTKESGR